MTVRVLQGDCRAVLATLPSASVHCCVTSPPYYGLRDYGCGGQIGIEQTPDAYVVELVAVFREARRVLRCDGTLWLNLGDSYAGGGNGNGGNFAADRANWRVVPPRSGQRCAVNGLKAKDLLGIPWRVAFALQQPYAVPVCVQKETDRAWLAAMFDGEGCIGIRRFDSYRGEVKYQDGFVVYTVVTNNDVELLERCVAITGKGKVTLKQKAEATDKRGIVSRRDSYGWRLDGNDAVDVIRAIYPYLVAKRKQAVIANTLDFINKNKRRVDGRVPADDQEKKVWLHEHIKKCNQREPVDMPGWLFEPRQETEPGWFLRQDIIWSKPNPMPESVTDRCTKAHEYVFLLSKSARYWYDAKAISEPAVQAEFRPTFRGGAYIGNSTFANSGSGGRSTDVGNIRTPNQMRNRRSVWTIATQPYAGAHFATMPPDLAELCILAGCPKGGTVLDPFAGGGTTGLVADRLGRNAILIELSHTYAAMARRRIEDDAGMFASVVQAAE